jgi:HSP20 family protein
MAQLPVHHRGWGLTRRSEWDPFERMQELIGSDPLESLSRLFRSGEAPGFIPTFEVKESKDGFVFKADLPGVDEKDIDVSVSGDRITVGGKRESEQHEESDRFYAYERSYGTFNRSFTLPEDVNADAVQASLKDGVLTLMLPKKPEAKSRKIPIGAGGKESGKAKA